MFEFSESRGRFFPGFCEAKEIRMVRVGEIIDRLSRVLYCLLRPT